jgi:hypothetical protein
MSVNHLFIFTIAIGARSTSLLSSRWRRGLNLLPPTDSPVWVGYLIVFHRRFWVRLPFLAVYKVNFSKKDRK